MMILVLAALLVFTVLMFLFKRWRIAMLILFISLMGITGSLVLLYLFHIPLNVSSYTGLIMIVGIVAENAILALTPLALGIDIGAQMQQALPLP